MFASSCFSFPDLIYCGRKLRDDQTLDFYGIQPGSTVHVLRKSWPEPDQKPGEEAAVGSRLRSPRGGAGVTEAQLLLRFGGGARWCVCVGLLCLRQ